MLMWSRLLSPLKEAFNEVMEDIPEEIGELVLHRQALVSLRTCRK